jgi:hypothetical protein
MVTSIEAFCQRVRTGLTDATFEQKRTLVALLIDRVLVANGDVEIRYVIPTTPRGETSRFYQLQKDYFAMPLVARPRASASELIGIGLAEFSAPFPNRLVGDDNATSGQQLFHIPVAEAEPEIQPDRVADDLGGEAVVLIAVAG